MTIDEIARVHHNDFNRALVRNDLAKLSQIYANDYMLVRPDGSVLNKEAVLHDLKLGGLTFKSIELVGQAVRIYGETAIVTGESRTLACRNGEELSSCFRLIAVYTRHAGKLKLIHFQSTPLPAERTGAPLA